MIDYNNVLQQKFYKQENLENPTISKFKEENFNSKISVTDKILPQSSFRSDISIKK